MRSSSWLYYAVFAEVCFFCFAQNKQCIYKKDLDPPEVLCSRIYAPYCKASEEGYYDTYGLRYRICRWGHSSKRCYASNARSCESVTYQSLCDSYVECVWDDPNSMVQEQQGPQPGTCRRTTVTCGRTCRQKYMCSSKSHCDNLDGLTVCGEYCERNNNDCADLDEQERCEGYTDCTWDVDSSLGGYSLISTVTLVMTVIPSLIALHGA